jgi:GDPmannose 4,6-dehydratase
MTRDHKRPGTAVVIGASGQDGYFLTTRLLAEGYYEVHAATRCPDALRSLAALPEARERLSVHEVELTEPSSLFELIERARPAEIYNLAGQSSVSRSFDDPIGTWRTNAGFVAELLECVRLRSPATRLYQASSSDMFGGAAGERVRHDEESVLNPQSPYASAKAAAHLLCRAYREAYDLRIACGILSNHESHRRPAQFLSRKIADYARELRRAGNTSPPAPLKMGNLKVRRDWGFAPDYVEGMQMVLRQIEVRSARARAGSTGETAADADEGRAYRDYVLGTGRTHAVWELVDAAFRLAGFALDWRLEGDEPARWHALFNATGRLAVEVDPELLRPTDPLAIEVDITRARRDLGWSPRAGVEVFLKDMLDNTPEHANAGS